MELRPGWVILEAAVGGILEPGFMNLPEKEQLYRARVFPDNILVRRDELLPEEESDRIVGMVFSASLELFPDVLPSLAYHFVVDHGGQGIIEHFLENHPEWEIAKCDCGNTQHSTLAKKEGERPVIIAVLLGASNPGHGRLRRSRSD